MEWDSAAGMPVQHGIAGGFAAFPEAVIRSLSQGIVMCLTVTREMHS
jgi:hypothetical protein